MATLFQVLQFFDGNGDPLNGGRVFWYEAGTTNLKDTYVDQAESAAAPNPIVLDAEGRPPLGAIWLRGSYKMRLTSPVTLPATTEENGTQEPLEIGFDGQVTFPLFEEPTSTGTFGLFLNGILKRYGLAYDYTFTGDVLTWNDPDGLTLKTTDELIAWYNFKPATFLSEDLLTINNINEYDQRDWTGLTASIADLNSTTTTTISVSAEYTVSISDRNKTILVNATSGALDVNLPNASSAGEAFRIYIKKVDAGIHAAQIKTASSETIDDLSTFYLYDYHDMVGLQSDGSNWHAIAHQIRGTERSISADTNILLVHDRETWSVNAAAADRTITLPLRVDVGRGFRITVKKFDSSSNKVEIAASGSETIDGASSVVIKQQYVALEFIAAAANWIIKSGYELETAIPLPRDYIGGMLIDLNPLDAEHDIRFSAGDARDALNTTNMRLTGTIIKEIDHTWAEGSAQGGLPSTVSLTPDTWYHCFVISKPGTNTQEAEKTDAGFDDNISATKLLNQAGAFGYTKYRWVGAVKTDSSSNIIPFFEYIFGGLREFHWKTLVNDASESGSGPSSGSITLNVPPGKVFSAQVNVSPKTGSVSSVRVYLRSPAQTDQTVDVTTPVLNAVVLSEEKPGVNVFRISTNTSQTINYKIDIDQAGDAWNLYVSTSLWVAPI